MKIFNKKTFKQTITFLLYISDSIALLLSLALAYVIRFHTSLIESIPSKLATLEPRKIIPGSYGAPLSAESIYLITSFCLIPLWLFLFKYFRLYREKRSASRIDNWITISKSVSLGTLIFLVATFFVRAFIYSRLVMVMFWVFDIILTVLGRVGIRNIEASFRKKGFDIRKAILVGHSRVGDILFRDMTKNLSLGFRFLGWIDDNPPSDREVLCKFADIPKIAAENQPLDVFIVDHTIDRIKILNMIADCEVYSVRFLLSSGLFDIMTNKNMHTISGFPMLEFGQGHLSPWKQKTKRIFDICLSIFSLILLAPLFIIIPLLIKFKIGSPVIFKQRRIGKDSVPFTIYKFTSMFHDVDPYSPAPNSLEDERITSIGRFLRRTSLDELPQFINVLKNDMSIVGPRPEMPFLVAKQNHWERKRLSVKPGMTGVWQTMGRSEFPLQDHLEFDLYYVHNQSLFFDLQIILRTILVVLFGKGAY